MKNLIFIAALFLLAAATPAFGKGNSFQKIVEVSPASITISLGRSGEVHQTFKITEGTKVTINGAPGSARDIRAGMVAHVTPDSDKTTAKSIVAKEAPRRSGRVG